MTDHTHSRLAGNTDVCPTQSHELLADIGERYWRFSCFEQPLAAILAGEKTTDAALFRESPADHDRRCASARELLAELVQISTNGLSAQDHATFKLMRRELETIVSFHDVKAHLRPSLFPAGPDFNLVFFANAANANSVQAARLYLSRLETIPAFIQDLRDALSAGHEFGFRYPKFVLSRAAAAVRSNLANEAESSALYGPFKRSTAIASGPVKNASQAAARLIAERIQPALEAYAGFLEAELAQDARDSIACTDEFMGQEFYEVLTRHYTSLDLAPAQVHQLGLDEVDRLQAEIDRVAAEAGFAGDSRAYRHYLATDKSFLASSKEELLEDMQVLCKRIDSFIPAYFGRLPRITYGVQSIPEGLSESLPPAYAQPSPADNSSPGIFWLTSLPEKCPSYLYPSLALHEAWPGHLMQIALMQEQEHLPKFRRNGALKYTACIEGWAMYCEQLGIPMGLYPGPHENFGRLNMEMWRAVRLVLDTGIHCYGWTREQAINYMSERVSVPMEMITAEVDRYIALPGQALAYQPGNLKIRELRKRCERALGDDFDLRQFHDALISAGPVTLGVLDNLMENWLDDRRKEHGQYAA